MKRKALLWGALVALGVLTALVVATGAFGFDSPGQPSSTGTNTITWTGQGTTNGVINNEQCDANNDPYLLWIFTTDGATLGSPAPVLTIDGNDYSGFPHGNEWHFQTPYVDPSTVQDAHVTFDVAALGGGNMVLTISHGCPGTTQRPPAAAPTVSKDANGSYDNTFAWTVDKSADTDTVYSAGGGESGAVNYTVTVTHDSGTVSGVQVTGTITITNQENAPITIDGVTDQLSDGTVCDVTGGGSQTIAANGTASPTYECDLSALPGSPLTNTVSLSWSDQDLSDNTFLAAGTATFTTLPITFNESDIGNCVDVSDTIAGDLGEVCVGGDNPTTFTYPETFTGDPAGTCTSHDNTASATTEDTDIEADSNTVTVQDCQGADLTVTKTATGSFNRDYDWSVLKSQTTSSTPINSSASSVTVAYKVKATWSGPTDSGWQVKGDITVHNPNDWESVTLTGVSDAIDNGGTCTVSGNTTQTIAASSDSTGLTYVCTYASAPSPAAGTNTATATWDPTAASTPDGTNNGTAGVDFSQVTPTVTHDTTTVKDAFNGGAALTLGVANVNGTFIKAAGNNLANWASSYTLGTKTFTFTYTRSVAVVANTCKEYDNTATVSPDATGGDNSSSASVVVCGKVTGGLTIGFWSNNNGKAVLCAHDPGWRQLLNGSAANAPYNAGSYLRNANGTIYTVPTGGSCATADSNFSNWLLGANSANASYMLSAQLAGTILNVNFNGMNGNLCIAGVGGTPISINNLIATVITFLKANGNTTAAGPARTLAVQYQTILNGLNNGQGFVVPGSC